MRAPFFVPANPHTCTPDTPTRPRPFPSSGLPVIVSSAPLLVCGQPLSTTALPTALRDSFLHFFLPLWTHKHNSTTKKRRRNRPSDPSFINVLSVINKATLLRDPSLPSANRLDLLLHLFSHRTVKAVLVSTLSTHSTTLSQFQPLNCILRTSFHMGQADGRKTLSILEYSADTRARAHSRRKESRHSPGTNLPRHLLQPACPVNPAGRLA